MVSRIAFNVCVVVPVREGTTGAALLKMLGLLDQSPAQARHISDARHKMSLGVKKKYQAMAQMRLFSDHDPAILELVVEKASKEIWKEDDVGSSVAIKEDMGEVHLQMSPGTAMKSKGDSEFLATIRQVFLSSLNTTYEGMIHHYELPQESGNLLLHSTKVAMDDAGKGLTNWEMLEGILNSKGVTRQLLAGAHISDPRSQLTILLCFIEAHERTADTVFAVFGADDGADSVEEAIFEREVEANRAAAERAILNLGLSEDDIRGERTAVMIKMLEREVTNDVKSYVSKGIISHAASTVIVDDVKRGIRPPTAEETTASAVARRIKSFTQGKMKKSASGLLQSYSTKSLTSLAEEAMNEMENEGVKVSEAVDVTTASEDFEAEENRSGGPRRFLAGIKKSLSGTKLDGLDGGGGGGGG